jgi:hypothetical protein
LGAVRFAVFDFLCQLQRGLPYSPNAVEASRNTNDYKEAKRWFKAYNALLDVDNAWDWDPFDTNTLLKCNHLYTVLDQWTSMSGRAPVSDWLSKNNNFYTIIFDTSGTETNWGDLPFQKECVMTDMVDLIHSLVEAPGHGVHAVCILFDISRELEPEKLAVDVMKERLGKTPSVQEDISDPETGWPVRICV